MFRIAAVQKKENGVIEKVLVDFETTLGKDQDEAKMAFTIKYAEELSGKEASLVVTGPFC